MSRLSRLMVSRAATALLGSIVCLCAVMPSAPERSVVSAGSIHQLARIVTAHADTRLPGQAAPRPFPRTTSGIAVFADQLPSSMSEAQFRFAATHYAGMQKMTRRDADHLRRYNPAMVIIHYRLPLGESDTSVQIIDGNQWISDYAAVNRHESWFYHRDGKREFMAQWHWYLMDPSSGWRDYWLRQVNQALAANADDGVFADSCSVPNYFGGSAWTPPLPDYDPAFEGAWSRRIDAFLTYVRPRLHGAKLIPNAGEWVTTRDATDYSLADGVMIEGFSEWAAHHPFPLSDWQLQMNRILFLERRHKIVIAQSYLDAPNDVATRRFYLANYLLIKGEYTYINYFAAQEPEWYPEWSLPIGRPTALLPANIGALYDARAGLYARAYSNGLVVVNPGTAPATLALHRTYYTATPVGGALPADANISGWHLLYTPVERITVAPNDAAILVGTPPGH